MYRKVTLPRNESRHVPSPKCWDARALRCYVARQGTTDEFRKHRAQHQAQPEVLDPNRWTVLMLVGTGAPGHDCHLSRRVQIAMSPQLESRDIEAYSAGMVPGPGYTSIP